MQKALRAGGLMLATGLMLAGCAATSEQQVTGKTSSGPPRSITLHHPASGETVSRVYWQAGRYDRQAMREISKLFRDRRSGEFTDIDPDLIDLMVALREKVGVPSSAPINITSGYRTSATNASLSRTNRNVAENSYHMRGQAADLHIPGVSAKRLATAAADLQRGGYALYAHTGHVHIDTGPVRTWVPRGPEQRNTDIRMASASSRQTKQTKAATAVAARPPAAKPGAARTMVASAAPARATPAKAQPAKIQPAKVQPAKVQLAKAQPGKAQPAKAVAGTPAGRPTAKPDLSKVRVVLAQLKDQPAPSAKSK